MLDLLKDYAVRHELVAEPGFAPKAARWGIECGSAQPSVIELPDTAGKKKGRSFDRCPVLSQPEIKRGGAGCRHFLLDTADVVAMISDPDDEKLQAKHRYFVDLLRRASKVMPDLDQVIRCLEDEDRLARLREDLLNRKAKPTDNVAFSVHENYLVDSTAWHDWWRTFRKSLSSEAQGKKKDDTPPMRCLVTGEMVEPVLTHPKIAGLVDVGGQSAGDVLASYKQDSFRSYGLVQAANAAMSEEAAALYSATLNHLLGHHGSRLGVVKVVHWFKKHVPPEDDPFGLVLGEVELEESAQDRARKLLASVRAGDRPPHLHGNYFYAMTLSGAAGRIMVHDWMEGQFETLVEAMNRWFEDLEIVRRDGSNSAPSPKLMAVLGALVRDFKDLPRPTATTMWRVAFGGGAIPPAFLAQALARLRVDIIKNTPVKHACVGLLKAYHRRQGDTLMTSSLNEDHPDPAYQCGRLMAIFDYLQYKALGDVGAGVVQRYYAAAAATPALVLGRLTRNAQYHLDKLDSKWKGFFQRRITDVMQQIRSDGFPETLDLKEQSLFALGYYHQKAYRSETKPDDSVEETAASS